MPRHGGRGHGRATANTKRASPSSSQRSSPPHQQHRRSGRRGSVVGSGCPGSRRTAPVALGRAIRDQTCFCTRSAVRYEPAPPAMHGGRERPEKLRMQGRPFRSLIDTRLARSRSRDQHSAWTCSTHRAVLLPTGEEHSADRSAECWSASKAGVIRSRSRRPLRRHWVLGSRRNGLMAPVRR